MLEIEKSEKLGDYSFFLAGKKAFFHSFADSGFKNKWAGFWAGNRKCIEYFALKCYNEWLSECNAKKISYFGSHCVQEFETKNGTVKQTLFVPMDRAALGVQIEAKKEAWFELELAINMRSREENWHGRAYETKEIPNGIIVEGEHGHGAVIFSVEKGQKTIKPESRYKEHSPGGEKQRCFLPAKIFLKGKKIVFFISFRKKKPRATAKNNFDALLKQKIQEYEGATSEAIECNNKQLEHGFGWSIVDLLLLENNQAYFAGLPWFLQLWARDLFWSLPAIINLGHFEKAQKILNMFMERAENGQIPNIIYAGESLLGGIDATPLWIIALAHYYRNSGDKKFLEKTKTFLLQALRFLRRRDTDNDGLIEHDEKDNETWMDSLNRKENAVEVQALYIKALYEAIFLMEELKEEKTAKELKARVFHSAFSFGKFRVFENFLADRLVGKIPVAEQTCNPLVAAMFGVCDCRDARHVLLEIESDVFDSHKGVRTLSKISRGFDPKGYHIGTAWSLSTGWASAAEFYWKQAQKGEHFLHKLFSDYHENALGCIGECWDSKTSELIGCGLQLWGAAFVIRIVDEFMLGMKANAAEMTIELNPCLPDGIDFIKRKKRVGKEWTEITIKRSGLELTAKSSNKKIKILLKEKEGK